MTALAIEGEPGLVLDDRETRRPGPSYTVDTLMQLRTELGDRVALVWLLGSDQLHNLATWHRWQDLLSYAHLAVTRREQIPLTDLPPEVEALVAAHGTDALPDEPCGRIVFFRMPMMPVSATRLRAQLAVGERPAELVPPRVLDYIDRHGLYAAAPSRLPPAT
jgi:nicotinate-nucleotide adenylyltransferase